MWSPVIGYVALSVAASKWGDASAASRDVIMFLLPRSVLISPLWQSERKGCARAQEGKVFVEKREWTSARCEA